MDRCTTTLYRTEGLVVTAYRCPAQARGDAPRGPCRRPRGLAQTGWRSLGDVVPGTPPRTRLRWTAASARAAVLELRPSRRPRASAARDRREDRPRSARRSEKRDCDRLARPWLPAPDARRHGRERDRTHGPVGWQAPKTRVRPRACRRGVPSRHTSFFPPTCSTGWQARSAEPESRSNDAWTGRSPPAACPLRSGPARRSSPNGGVR